MSSTADTVLPGRHIPLTSDEVKAYLRDNADLIQDDPEFAAYLLPREAPQGNLVDFQDYLVRRLQDQVSLLKKERVGFYQINRSNELARERTHIAVLRLLEARSFDDLVQIATRELSTCLGVDAVALCIETDGQMVATTPVPFDVSILPRGMVNTMIGSDAAYLLHSGRIRLPSIYGEISSQLESEALVRLNISPNTPTGLLALGSLESATFHSDQSTDLLDFLARTLERCFRTWLDLPAE